MTTALLTFALAALLLILLPGPDTMVVVRSIVVGGRRSGLACALGVLTALTVWIAAAAAGLAALLRASELAYDTLRVVGAVYLAVLGIQALRSSGRPASARRGGILGVGYAAGLMTDLLNPKVGVFFVTFLPGFIPAGHAVGTTSLILGLIFMLESLLYFVVLLSLADRVSAALQRPAVRRRVDRVTGGVLIAFGVRLATE